MLSGDPKDEYKSLGENIRWYSNIRFLQLTLFVALTAALINRLFSTPSTLSKPYEIALKIIGFFGALVFGYMEFRADQYWSHFMNRAVELEKDLSYSQYSTRPVKRIRTTHALKLFFIVIALFWMWSIFVEP